MQNILSALPRCVLQALSISTGWGKHPCSRRPLKGKRTHPPETLQFESFNQITCSLVFSISTWNFCQIFRKMISWPLFLDWKEKPPWRDAASPGTLNIVMITMMIVMVFLIVMPMMVANMETALTETTFEGGQERERPPHEKVTQVSRSSLSYRSSLSVVITTTITITISGKEQTPTHRTTQAGVPSTRHATMAMRWQRHKATKQTTMAAFLILDKHTVLDDLAPNRL